MSTLQALWGGAKEAAVTPGHALVTRADLTAGV